MLCRSSVSALLSCLPLCSVSFPCSVLCHNLSCALLCFVFSPTLFCSALSLCFGLLPNPVLPCFALKFSSAYECFGARLFSYFGLSSVLVLCILPLALLHALRCFAFARHFRSATRWCEFGSCAEIWGAARNCSNSVTTPTSSSHPTLTPATSPQCEHPKVAEKISKGQFVDMTKLLPDSWRWENASLQLPSHRPPCHRDHSVG